MAINFPSLNLAAYFASAGFKVPPRQFMYCISQGMFRRVSKYCQRRDSAILNGRDVLSSSQKKFEPWIYVFICTKMCNLTFVCIRNHQIMNIYFYEFLRLQYTPCFLAQFVIFQQLMDFVQILIFSSQHWKYQMLWHFLKDQVVSYRTLPLQQATKTRWCHI